MNINMKFHSLPIKLEKFGNSKFSSLYICMQFPVWQYFISRDKWIVEQCVWSLGWEDLREKEMATHFSTLAWKIPWTEEPGRLQSMGSQKVEHDWTTSLSFFEKHGRWTAMLRRCPLRQRAMVLWVELWRPLCGWQLEPGQTSASSALRLLTTRLWPSPVAMPS